MKPRILALVVLFSSLTLCLLAAQPGKSLPEPRLTNTWDGSYNDNWHSGINWSQNHAPLSYELASIPAGTPNSPVLSSNATVSQVNLQSGATLTVSAGLTISNDLDVYGTLVMETGGYMHIDGDLFFYSGSLADVQQTNTIYLKGTVEFHESIAFYGAIRLNGTLNQYVCTYSASQIGYLIVEKTSGSASISALSTAAIHIRQLNVATGNTFYHPYGGTTYILGRFDIDPGATCEMDAGMLVFQGTTSPVVFYFDGSGYLNSLKIDNSAMQTTLHNDIYLKGNMYIEGGGLDAASYTIRLEGHWHNSMGPDGFWESLSRVVFCGSSHQYCSGSENFHILELDKPSGALRIENSYVDLTCDSFDWTSGAVDILGGTFTVDDLIDAGFFGAWYLNEGGTINVTNDDGFIDLNADFHIFGGDFNIHGGLDNSYWAYSSNASLEMSGGVLDFKDQGISIQAGYAFNETITGGTIRTAGDFIINRSDFNPAAGVIELYGSADADINIENLSNLYDLAINKPGGAARNAGQPVNHIRQNGDPASITRSNTVTANSNLDINGHFKIMEGVFNAPAEMRVRKYWYNYAGDAAFNEGTGTVVFDGNYTSYIQAAENFNDLELDKPTTSWQLVSASNVTCNSFDWTSGKLRVPSGTFTALDLVDPGIYGVLEVSGGTVNFHQDTGQRCDLWGNLIISAGVLNVHGGSSNCCLSYGGTSTLTMSGGMFDMHDKGLYTSAILLFNDEISGGTIRTVGNFINNRSDFNPTGGTIEFYGPNNCTLDNTVGGNFFSIEINKSSPTDYVLSASPVVLEGDLTITCGKYYIYSESLTVNNAATITIGNGTMDVMGNIVATSGNVIVNGNLFMGAGSRLRLSHGKSLTVNDGGCVQIIGTASDPATITHNAAGQYYALNIESGGTIAAEDTVFEYMNRNGVQIKEGSLVDTNHCLDHCVFWRGLVNGALLKINNGQDLTINGAVFPANTWSGTYNVSKALDQGTVYFTGWSGDFCGSAYEYDPYNRVLWQGEAIPAITDLSISYIEASNQIRLDWSYPYTTAQYKIYRRDNPYGTYSWIATTSNTYWLQSVPGDKYFYRVTAVMP